MTAKVRVHKEWFRLIKKRNCGCGKTKTDVYSWGEYRNAKWHTVEYVCQSCWGGYADKLNKHHAATGSKFELVAKDCKLPAWLTLEKPPEAEPSLLEKFSKLINDQLTF